MAKLNPFLFTPITTLTDAARISQLVPLGLFNAPGARGGAVGPASVKPARLGVPSLAESTVMPGAVYAFERDGLPRLQLAAAQIRTITTGLVTWQDEQAESAPQQSAHWSAAWRTGLTGWTNDVAALVGAWVRAAGRAALQPEWRSCADISAMTEQELWVWLPGRKDWKLVPRIESASTLDASWAAPLQGAATPKELSPDSFEDTYFKANVGSCKNNPGGLISAASASKFLHEINAVHTIDRSSAYHYLGEWGDEEHVLPQASVVFVRGTSRAIREFYEWMRHVDQPVYPVLHDCEWMKLHAKGATSKYDKYQKECASYCGHPSLIISPAHDVAVGVVFKRDLDSIRGVLSQKSGRELSDGGRPSWLPDIGGMYPYVLSVAAGWALSDHRLGWRVCVPARPVDWQMNLYLTFYCDSAFWAQIAKVRRWPQKDCEDWFAASPERYTYPYQHYHLNPYITDAYGRSPYVRSMWADDRVKNIKNVKVKHGSSLSKLSLETQRASLLSGCGQDDFSAMEMYQGAEWPTSGETPAAVLLRVGSNKSLYVDQSLRVVSSANGCSITLPVNDQ
jgi:hypothetical protein